MKYLITVSFFLLLTAMSCKKNKNESDQLPPTTQIGANTFGCLVNGKIYIPKGYSGTGTPNPKVIFDMGINGFPYLQIDARQYDGNSQNGSLVINIDSCVGIGEYFIHTTKKQIGFGSYLIPNCGVLPNDNSQFKTGSVIITEYNLSGGIISGTFGFKLKPNNCDTLFFTDGRFDLKL